MAENVVMINRAPVLALWAAVVAERLGYDHAAALTLGKAVAGLNAQAKGRRLGFYRKPGAGEAGKPPKKAGLGEEFWVSLCGRPVPAKQTEDGIRAVVRDQPIDPASVERYVESKFGDSLKAVRRAMESLASAYPPAELEQVAFGLYERFRPEIAEGKRGWGQAGELNLERIRSLAKRA
jgi:hypothetical protein